MTLPLNLDYTRIKQTRGFVTALDRYDLSDDFAYRTRGFLNSVKGYVGQRDQGTQQRYADLPYLPNPTKAITGFAADGTEIKITVVAHGRATGDIIVVAGVTGTGATLVNGIWTVTKLAGNDTLSLDNSTWDGALSYANGKIATLISLRKGTTLYDKDTVTEHEIVVGVDVNGKMRVFAYDAGWVHLTAITLAAINGTPAAAAAITDTVPVNINTIVDEGGNTIVPANDELIGWIAYNVTRGNASIIVDNTATQITVCHDVNKPPWGWLTTDSLKLYRSTAVYDGFNFANGNKPHIRFLGIEAQKKLTMFYADKTTAIPTRQTAIQIKKQSAQRGLFPSVTAGVAASGTITFNAPTLDVSTVTVNSVVFHYVTTITNPYTHFRNATELAAVLNGPTNAATLVTGSGIGPVTVTALTAGVAGNSITLATNGGFTLSGATLTGGVDGAGVGRLTLPVGWYLEKAFPSVKSQTLGSIAIPKRGTSAVTAAVIGDGMQVVATFSEVGNVNSYHHVRAYIIPIYRGGQYGGPIFKLFLSGSTILKFPLASLSLVIDPVLVNKDITGFRLYVANATNGKPSQADWFDDSTEYVLTSEKQMASNDAWVFNNSAQGCYSVDFNTGDEGDYDENVAAENESIVDSLNHRPVMDRTELKPMFAVHASRGQASIIVADQAEDVLRLTNYNGDGLHEDDNFPEGANDENGKKLKLLLTSKGNILGLDIGNGLVGCLKFEGIELNNLDSGEQKILPADVYSPDSIIRHDYGLTWSGVSGAYLLPNGSFEILDLFQDIKNFFDGSELIDNNSISYVTAAYRSAVISGWDPCYGVVWFHMQVNKDIAQGGGSEYLNIRLALDPSTYATNYSVRQLNIGNDFQPVQYFSKSRDGFLTIGYATGILKYPVQTGARRFEDDVRSDGVTAGRGIPGSTLIHLGSISDLIQTKSPYSIMPGFRGESVDKMGMVTMNIYADDLVLIDTMQFRIDEKPEEMYIKPIGGVKRLWVEFVLPTNPINIKMFDLSEVAIGHVRQP